MSYPLKFKLCDNKDSYLFISDTNNWHYFNIIFISFNWILMTNLIVSVLQMRRLRHREATELE